MILEAYGAALLIAVGAAVVGQAICTAAGGGHRWWAAPGVGLAALIIVAAAAIELPGRAVPAVVLTAILILASAAFLWRRRQPPGDWVQMVTGLVALIAASLPFLASGRVGLQGVGLDDDTAHFLVYAEGLRSARMEHLWGPGNGYPLGPPSLATVVSSAIGAPLDLVFGGLLLAVVVITAMVAAGVLGNRRPWRRILVGVMCALAYLAAAYYGEGAFKETVMAVLLLAFVLALEHVSGPRRSLNWRSLLPAVILVAAGVYTYSYTAVAWFAGTVVVWLVAETISRPRQILTTAGWEQIKAAAGPVGLSVLVLLVLLLPVWDQIRASSHQSGSRLHRRRRSLSPTSGTSSTHCRCTSPWASGGAPTFAGVPSMLSRRESWRPLPLLRSPSACCGRGVDASSCFPPRS